MITPKILLNAMRQYQHNDHSGLVFGFDYSETIDLVVLMQKIIEAQSELIEVYKSGKDAPSWVLDIMKEAKEANISMWPTREEIENDA